MISQYGRLGSHIFGQPSREEEENSRFKVEKGTLVPVSFISEKVKCFADELKNLLKLGKRWENNSVNFKRFCRLDGTGVRPLVLQSKGREFVRHLKTFQEATVRKQAYTKAFFFSNGRLKRVITMIGVWLLEIKRF